MKGSRASIGIGLALVAAGVLFLLQNFGIFGDWASRIIWLVLFGGAGLVFLGVYATNREHWWAVIPGFTLLGLSGLVAFGDLLGAAGGALFLAAIGLSFWVIYATRRDFWWAVIPGGTLFTLAGVALVSEVWDGEMAGGLFFLGLAATFGLVYLLPTQEGRMKWALIPAGVLAAMGVLILATMSSLINYVWPLALVAAGVVLVLRTLMARR